MVYKMIFAIIFFFIMSIGLGIGAVTLLKLQFKNPLEKILMSIGFGLGIFPILAVTLNLFRVPLHWITFFILGIAGFILLLYKFPKIEFRLTISNLFIIAAVVLSVILLFVYVKGSYS